MSSRIARRSAASVEEMVTCLLIDRRPCSILLATNTDRSRPHGYRRRSYLRSPSRACKGSVAPGRQPTSELLPMALKPSGSAGWCGVRDRPAAPRKTIVETDRTRTESYDLKQATRHHDVLEEVDHLVLVGEVAVERHTRDHRKHCQRKSDRPNLVASDQQEATAEFED